MRSIWFLPCSGKSRLTLASSIDWITTSIVVAVTFVGTVGTESAGRTGLAAVHSSPTTGTPEKNNSTVQTLNYVTLHVKIDIRKYPKTEVSLLLS